MLKYLLVGSMFLSSLAFGWTPEELKKQSDYLKTVDQKVYSKRVDMKAKCAIKKEKIEGMNVFMPTGGTGHPVLIWFNGTGAWTGWYQEGLEKLAKQCIVVVANPDPMILYNSLIEWVSPEKTYKTINLTVNKILPKLNGLGSDKRIAVTGHSQGGGAAIFASEHPMVKTTIPIQPLMLNSKAKKPILFLTGEHDIIVNTGLVKALSYTPYKGVKMIAERQGHLSGHIDWNNSGGYFTKPIVKWVNWHLRGDKEAKKYFRDVHSDPSWKAESSISFILDWIKENIKKPLPPLGAARPLAPKCFDFEDFDPTRKGPFAYKYEKKKIDGVTHRIYIPEVPAYCKMPVVFWSIATNTGCPMYRDHAGLLSSYGILTGCNETKNQQKGDDGLNFLNYAISNYNVDSTRVGAVGHSQGGSAATEFAYTANATKLGSVRATVGVAPAWGFMGNRNGWDRTIYDRLGQAPSDQYFFNMTGSRDIMVGFQREKGYESISNSPIFDAEIKGKGHVDILNAFSKESAAAFFVWRLLDNKDAEKWFMGECKLCKKEGWTVRKKLLD